MIYLYLFVSFLQVGMFSFGGGYAAMPLIQEQVVTIHHWLDISEFTDLVTISQMTPGPISINAATFVGIKVAGIPGAVVGEGKRLDDDCTISVDHGCFMLSLGNVDANDVHSIGSSHVQITDIPRAAEGHNLLRD